MIWIARVLVAAFGLVFGAMGVMILLDPAMIIAQFELGNPGLTGRSAIRADLGAFFLASGTFALVGLIPGRHQWLLGAILLFGTAFVGRAIGVAAKGSNGAIIESMIVEAISLAVLGLAFVVLGKAQKNQLPLPMNTDDSASVID